MPSTFIGKTKNGFSVFVDIVNSHAATHFKETPELFELTKEVIEGLEVQDDELWFDKDMGRVIGTSDCIETQRGDEIIYAKRPNRDNYSRFVKNRSPEPTNYITLWLKKKTDGEFELLTAYIGRKAPSFPGNEFETPESHVFWDKHALVWGNQEVVPGTETTVCPW